MGEVLLNQQCVPCHIGADPLSPAQIGELRPQLDPAWLVENNQKLSRDFTCTNFAQAVQLFNAIAQEAESQGHHPDLLLHDFQYLKVEWWTHKIHGLHQNDFIMAAKTDTLYNAVQKVS